MANQATVEECEEYIQRHGVQQILKNCIAKICQERPLQPYSWLKDYFDKLDRVRDCRFCLKASLKATRLRLVSFVFGTSLFLNII